MKSVVIYHSQFGNTKTLAEVIGKSLEAFGDVKVVSIEKADLNTLKHIDLLVVGGPTQGHSTSPAVRPFLEQLAAAGVAGLKTAAFDTRLKGPEILWGSAAKSTAASLKRAGLDLVAPPESFMVKGARHPELDDGEIERAKTWASAIGKQLAQQAVTV